MLSINKPILRSTIGEINNDDAIDPPEWAFKVYKMISGLLK